MKKFRVFTAILLTVCFFAAVRSSVGEAKPVNPALVKGVLYMTANVRPAKREETEPPAPAEEPPAEPAEDKAEKTPVVFRRTITTAPLSYEGLYISNLAKVDFSISELLSMPPETDGGQVLILHTHGCEAYTPTKENSYSPTSDFRTTDENFNVVRVGDEIESALTGMGVKVIHDRTLCDYPSYTESYNNSLALAKKYVEENPDIKVILDIHRDSVAGENGEQIKTVGGEGAAQLMFVVGTDGAGLEHPLWRQNLSFALNLQKRIIAKHPDLMRPINLRSHRFNQQVSTGSLIVEVGSDGNTLEEALAAARIFARELGEYLTEEG